MKLQREYCFDYFLSNIVNEEETIRLCNSKLMIHCVVSRWIIYYGLSKA